MPLYTKEIYQSFTPKLFQSCQGVLDQSISVDLAESCAPHDYMQDLCHINDTRPTKVNRSYAPGLQSITLNFQY